jgi:acyl-CoA reductase-like NAD-dependent aldehyde dehydrogenase
MELSGCDAVFICPDADLDLACRGLAFALGFNGGATCIAPRRVFMPREMEAALRDQLLPKVERLPAAQLSPDAVDRLGALLEDAAGRGARVLGGARESANRIRPAIVLEADPDSPLLRADLMGPVLAIVPVENMEQALRLNDLCPYRLGATVFGSARSAQALAPRIDAGVVLVNDVILPHADARLPFGGRGRSGFGVTRGAQGLLEMTRPKAISRRSGTFRPHYDLPQPSDEEMFAQYIRAAHGSCPLDRARAAVAVVRNLIGRAR